MEINRSEASRALAKAIAYKNCGDNINAELWATRLMVILQLAEILK